jgi:hypothetical protein
MRANIVSRDRPYRECALDGATMIRVIGIDIPRGWAVVDVGLGIFGKPADGIAFGELDVGREAEHFTELVCKWKPARLAIETPMEAYVHGRGATGNEGQRRSVVSSLITCAMLAGEIKRMGIVLGLGVTVNDADTVRKALGIRGRTRTEKDQAVKQYVMTRVRGWPNKSNADERDAACVAIYGGMAK